MVPFPHACAGHFELDKVLKVQFGNVGIDALALSLLPLMKDVQNFVALFEFGKCFIRHEMSNEHVKIDEDEGFFSFGHEAHKRLSFDASM